MQTPENNPLNCVVLEFEDPLIRSISSELLCSLNEASIAIIKQALNVASYMAQADIDINKEVVLALDLKELFQVRTYQEGTVQDQKIVFNKLGMQVWGEEEEYLYFYKDVMPDNAGNRCAMWYKNLVLPKELNIADTKQCFVFKKAPYG